MKAKRLLEIIRDFEYPHVNEAVQIKTATDWRQLCLMESKVETLEWFLGFAVGGNLDFDIKNLRETTDPETCDGKIVEIDGVKYQLKEVEVRFAGCSYRRYYGQKLYGPKEFFDLGVVWLKKIRQIKCLWELSACRKLS